MTDSTKLKCFTIKQVRQIDKAIKRSYVSDSVIKYQDRVIMRGDSILGVQESRFNDLSTLALVYEKENKRLAVKVKVLSNSFKIVVPAALGVGIYLGYTLSK